MSLKLPGPAWVGQLFNTFNVNFSGGDFKTIRHNMYVEEKLKKG